MFSTDENGKKKDRHLHVETDEHRAAFSRMAVERAMREGMGAERAQRLFGFKGAVAGAKK